MQLINGTSKNALIPRTYFLTFGDSLDHSTDYPLADLVNSLNQWMHTVGLWIWSASGTWEFDDSNYTTLPISTTDMTDGQEDYALPTNIIQIEQVEVMDNAGNWKKIDPIEKDEVREAFSQFENTPAFPRYYDIVANSIILKPAPSASLVTLAGGLKVYLTRLVNEFSVPASYTSVDTTIPGFSTTLHDILCLGASYDYLQANEQFAKANQYLSKINLMHADLNQLYGGRDKDNKTSIKRRVESFN